MSELERLRDALREAIAYAVKPDARYRYDRCRLCGCTWWGRTAKPERERHNRGCPVRNWRRDLNQGGPA